MWSSTNPSSALTRFEDFSFPELAVWRVDCLFGAVIPTHGHPELPHPSAARGVREWGRDETNETLTLPPADNT